MTRESLRAFLQRLADAGWDGDATLVSGGLDPMVIDVRITLRKEQGK